MAAIITGRTKGVLPKRTKGIVPRDVLPPNHPTTPRVARSSRGAPPRPGKPFCTDRPLGKILEFKGLTVAELSAMVLDAYGPNHGLNITMLSYYLNGKREITDDHRMKLARVLRVKEEWL